MGNGFNKPLRTEMTTIVAIVSDIHANSTVAVCPPRVRLDDGGDYVASPVQRWIWQRWREYWQRVAEQRAGNRLIVILNGELADHNSHTTTELVSQNPATIMRLSAMVLEPMLSLLDNATDDTVYVTRGTQAHTGPASHYDEKIAEDIGAVPLPGGKTFSRYILNLNVEGVKFNVAHHPPSGGGTRPWTQAATAVNMSSTVRYAMLGSGRRESDLPHLFIRGHRHVPGDSGGWQRPRVLLLPSWQGRTEFSHRLGSFMPLPVGGAIVTCDRGRYDAQLVTYNWPVEGYEAT